MNKEIQVLYTIFELELAPPFELVDDPMVYGKPDIHNRFSEKIGWYDMSYKTFNQRWTLQTILLNKIKQTFNVDELSDDDVYHIAKHFVNWANSNFPMNVVGSQYHNIDSGKIISYPERKY